MARYSSSPCNPPAEGTGPRPSAPVSPWLPWSSRLSFRQDGSLVPGPCTLRRWRQVPEEDRPAPEPFRQRREFLRHSLADLVKKLTLPAQHSPVQLLRVQAVIDCMPGKVGRHSFVRACSCSRLEEAHVVP